MNVGNNEILVSKATLVNNKRPLFIFAVYYPPKLRASDVRESLLCISDCISQLKLKHKNPYVLIGGDVNQFPINEAIDDHDDIGLLPTLPTRGDACLDVIASNFNDQISDHFVEAPLETDECVQSDHGVLVARANLVHTHEFTWIKYRTRQIDEESKRFFIDAFRRVDWSAITNQNKSMTV